VGIHVHRKSNREMTQTFLNQLDTFSILEKKCDMCMHCSRKFDPVKSASVYQFYTGVAESFCALQKGLLLSQALDIHIGFISE
jgi:uncharacterized protein with PIN domain